MSQAINFLSIQGDSGRFHLLEQTTSAGASAAWAHVGELKPEGAFEFPELPEQMLRRAGRAAVALVAPKAWPGAWNLPPSVLRRGRLQATVWRPEPSGFAFGARRAGRVDWLVRPPSPPSSGGRVQIRNGTEGSWVEDVREAERRSGLLRAQILGYETVLRGLFEGDTGLEGQLVFRGKHAGKPLELALAFAGGNVHFLGLDGERVGKHPLGPMAGLAFDVVPVGVPPDLNRATVAPGDGWVYALLEGSAPNPSWRADTEPAGLLARASREGKPL